MLVLCAFGEPAGTPGRILRRGTTRRPLHGPVLIDGGLQAPPLPGCFGLSSGIRVTTREVFILAAERCSDRLGTRVVLGDTRPAPP